MGAEQSGAEATAVIVVGAADDGPSFFRSVDHAAGYIEWQDVEAQVWGPGFDRGGHRVMLSLIWPESGWPDVVVTVDVDGPPRREALRRLLCVGADCHGEDLRPLTLAQLFALAQDRSGLIP